MHTALREILDKHSSRSSGDRHTHFSYYGPTAKWYIEPSSYPDFWTSYCQLVATMEETDPLANLCLAERNRPVLPVVSKLTFRFDLAGEEVEEEWEPYRVDFLHYLVHTYQTVLLDNFKVSPERRTELIAVVLESDLWVEENRENQQRFLVKEVKIHFPYANVDTELQSRRIRPQVIKLLRHHNLFSMLERQPVHEWESIIADNVNDPFLLYGSTEEPGRPKSVLTHIWSHIDKEMIDDASEPNEYELSDAFVPPSHGHVRQGAIKEELFETQPLKFWMPLFLSADYYPGLLLVSTQPDNHPRTHVTREESGRIFGTRPSLDELYLSDLEIAERLLPLLHTERFLIETSWLDIGKALHTSDNGKEDGLNLWIRFTEKAANGTIPEFLLRESTIALTCQSLYHSFFRNETTNKTLAWFASQDYPERYANWHREWCLPALEMALSATHHDVSMAFYRVFWLNFIYDESADKWFMFSNHRWTEMSQMIDLRRALSEDFVKRYESVRVTLSRQIRDSTDNNVKEIGELTMKKIGTLIDKLKNDSFKASVVKNSREFFNNKNFIRLLDCNPNLTGVVNGVIEVCGKICIFRAGKPEDYVSMCSLNKYEINFNWNHPLVKELMIWLGQAFVEKELLHYFLKFSASCLKARNSDKIFAIWTGCGDNSKSMIVKLFTYTLGSYAIKFPVCMLTENERSSGSATPQFARAKATRIGFLDEPEDHISINKGTIKRFTGGDSFFARFLHSNGGEIEATFKMVLMCNKIPNILNPDKAVKNRIYILPFLSKWVIDPPASKEEQYRQRLFKVDRSFEHRIMGLSPAFLWVMSQYYPYYIEEGLTVPQVVIDSTNSYWKDNDIYAQFAAAVIEPMVTPDGEADINCSITLTALHNEFKDWFKSACPGRTIPDRATLCAEFSSRWGRMQNSRWYGFRIIREQDDLNSLLGGKKLIKNVSAKSPGASPSPVQEPVSFIKPLTPK